MFKCSTSGDVIEHLMQKDNKMMNLVTQVRGEGLLGLFQEVRKAAQKKTKKKKKKKETNETLYNKPQINNLTIRFKKKLFSQEKKKFQSSFDNSFLEESKSGNQAIDLFLDRANPYNKVTFLLVPSANINTNTNINKKYKYKQSRANPYKKVTFLHHKGREN